MLKNLDYIAAIVPESFLTSGLFQERLYAVISLTYRMFDDTECPVCLALFVPEETSDFQVYAQNHLLGTYAEMLSYVPKPTAAGEWRFNDVKGNIGIRCIDFQTKASIRFIPGEEVDPEKIKVSSRSLTRVSGLPDNIPVEEFLDACNKILTLYRADTHDIFLTSFKGLRKDGKYRRRLDFKTARMIMNEALETVKEGKI